ncbi:FK506-binding protein 5-like [Prorops nasuta]|uniref:FK506-binding protein 5-like n=1 Tax=Prorops nasuta TaxID=863751 RepID=UPI0034CEC1E9
MCTGNMYNDNSIIRESSVAGGMIYLLNAIGVGTDLGAIIRLLLNDIEEVEEMSSDDDDGYDGDDEEEEVLRDEEGQIDLVMEDDEDDEEEMEVIVVESEDEVEFLYKETNINESVVMISSSEIDCDHAQIVETEVDTDILEPLNELERDIEIIIILLFSSDVVENESVFVIDSENESVDEVDSDDETIIEILSMDEETSSDNEDSSENESVVVIGSSAHEQIVDVDVEIEVDADILELLNGFERDIEIIFELLFSSDIVEDESVVVIDSEDESVDEIDSDAETILEICSMDEETDSDNEDMEIVMVEDMDVKEVVSE